MESWSGFVPHSHRVKENILCFEADFVEESALRSLTIHGRSRRELAEIVELLNAYRARFRKRRRRKKHSGTQ